ncbi:retinoic acid receptor responder protein 2 isoform X1 [Saccopteryx bilineata]|uniref:retinoic acid receptor responder protein 2 isoform X1 n=1 Tax=Saccopteryx bilineata TaxID=59482 RepID=UPI00339052CF
MWRLLILLALWLGTVGLGRAELTAAQHQGLRVALEEFHKHPRVQWAFQKTSVDNATETVFPKGTFVKIEFKLQQTDCWKKDWKKTECKAKPTGRKRKCLACIKLDPDSKVLGRMVHCPLETQVQQLAPAGVHGAPGDAVQQGGAGRRGPAQTLLPRTICLPQVPLAEVDRTPFALCRAV